jgi:hypothetical protein
MATQLAARANFNYPNTRVRNLKFKSMALQRRKERRKGTLGGIPSPKETTDEIPPFFLPARNKLFFQLIADLQNSKRYARKPIP